MKKLGFRTDLKKWWPEGKIFAIKYFKNMNTTLWFVNQIKQKKGVPFVLKYLTSFFVFCHVDLDYRCQIWIYISSFHKKGASNKCCMIWQHSSLLFLKNKRIINYIDAWDVSLFIWDVVPIISIAFLIIYPLDWHWIWMQKPRILVCFSGHNWYRRSELLSLYVLKIY